LRLRFFPVGGDFRGRKIDGRWRTPAAPRRHRHHPWPAALTVRHDACLPRFDLVAHAILRRRRAGNAGDHAGPTSWISDDSRGTGAIRIDATPASISGEATRTDKQ